MTKNGAMIGTGFFAGIQMPAWKRVPDASITAVCDIDEAKAHAFAQEHNIPNVYSNINDLLTNETLDFVDIVTRPDSHLSLVQQAVNANVAILCQKPLAPTYDEAKQIVALTQQTNTRFMVNENWRWQRWYREMKQLITKGAIGEVFHATVRMRTADGRGDTPYASQPYFREYKRMLVFETLVHFIDTLRFFMGEIERVHAALRRINPAIKGEDFALITLEFVSGATAVIDANRFSEPAQKSEAFGRVVFEGRDASLQLNEDLSIHLINQDAQLVPHAYEQPGGYKGASAQATQAHFIDCLNTGKPFETNGPDYLRSLAVVEAVYESAETKQVINVEYQEINQ